MGHNEAFISFIHDGLQRYGTHFGSSRNNTLQLDIYDEAEERFSKFTGAPASLLVSSGMWAGQTALNYLSELYKANAREYYAPYTHPALRKTNSANNFPDSWNEWAQATVHHIIQDPSDKKHIIFTDSIRSPWPEVFDFAIFNRIPSDRNVMLIVDDSHGIGVLGKDGQGSYTDIARRTNAEVLLVASLNKAMGIPSGILLGRSETLQAIKKTHWFSGSSPASPGYIYAASQLLLSGEYIRAHERLISNIKYFQSFECIPALLESISGYPVYCSAMKDLHLFLLKNGILSACFPYPSPVDPAIVRLVINARHQKEDLNQLAEALQNFQYQSYSR